MASYEDREVKGDSNVLNLNTVPDDIQRELRQNIAGQLALLLLPRVAHLNCLGAQRRLSRTLAVSS
jgi:hypothetical protein